MLVLVSLSLLVVKFIFKAFKFEGFEMVWLAVVVVFVPLISAANPRLKPEVPKLLVAAAVWDIRAVVLEATLVVARAIFATKYFSSSFMLSIKSVNSSISEWLIPGSFALYLCFSSFSLVCKFDFSFLYCSYSFFTLFSCLRASCRAIVAGAIWAYSFCTVRDRAAFASFKVEVESIVSVLFEM